MQRTAMTQEEIHKVANSICPSVGTEIDEDYICCDERDFSIGFECGAKWVCKTMIEKACKWLEEIDFDCDYFRDGEDYFVNEILIDDFKKDMEEQL